MKYALYLPNFGTSSDPQLVAELAHEAEQAGWDGFFLSDNILWTDPHNQPVGDPWVMLAAIALATSRIRLGTMITPLPRRRPWTVARQATTIDHLSNGRLILGVGIGGDWHGDFSVFGEAADDKSHGELLDEALAIIAGLWSGEPFSFDGAHYQVQNVQFLPRPLQQARIPIWVGGVWPHKKPFRRAAGWDGMVASDRSAHGLIFEAVITVTHPWALRCRRIKRRAFPLLRQQGAVGTIEVVPLS